MNLTRRGFLLVWLIFGIFLLSLLSHKGELLALTMPLFIYLAIGYLFSSEEPSLLVEKEISNEKVIQGEPVVVKLRIRNVGSTVEEAYFVDTVPKSLKVIDGQPWLLTSLKRDEVVDWQYTVHTRRGFYWMKSIDATLNDSLGVFQKTLELPAEKTVMVTPRVSKLKHVAIRPRRTRVYSGIIPAGKGGAGTDFFGVREFQTGDSPRLINWKASARQLDGFFTNEFEQERVADVGLIVDSRYRSYNIGTRESLLEHTISAAASLSDALLRDGNRVGMLVYGGFMNWTFPGSGKIQRERILRSLANIVPYSSQVFNKIDRIPTQLFPVRSQLFYISPLLTDDIETLTALRSYGYHLMVISPNAVSFEQAELGPGKDVETAARMKSLERALIIRQTMQAGIQVIDWDVSQPFHHTVETTLHRHRFQQKNLKVG